MKRYCETEMSEAMRTAIELVLNVSNPWAIPACGPYILVYIHTSVSDLHVASYVGVCTSKWRM